MRKAVHPPTVHFPIGCWIIATIADIAYRWFETPDQKVFLAQFAVVLLAIGCIMALLSIFTGMIALVRLPQERSLQKGLIHAGVMALAFLLFVSSLFLRIDGAHPVDPSLVNLVLEILGSIILVIGGWLGGNLMVYSHGFGRSQEEFEHGRRDVH